jgi:hypothetical protein
MGICPKCEAPVDKLEIEQIDGFYGGVAGHEAVSYLCPSCHCVLGVEIHSPPAGAASKRS